MYRMEGVLMHNFGNGNLKNFEINAKRKDFNALKYNSAAML